MRHEKIIRREDGSRVMIQVEIQIDRILPEVNWKIFVSKCETKKKKFIHVVDTDNYAYRALSMAFRELHTQSEYLKHVTPEEIHQAKLELWEKLKPTL